MAMDTKTFWQEIRLRRDAVYGWWLAWIPVSITLAWLYRQMTHQEPDTAVAWTALIGWAVLSHFVIRRLSTLPCPRCGKPAVPHIFFRMQNAQCQFCGLRPGRS